MYANPKESEGSEAYRCIFTVAASCSAWMASAEAWIPIQRGGVFQRDIVAHLLGILRERPRDIDRQIQIDPHDGFQLPKRENNAAFSIENIRDGIGSGGFRPGKFQFRSLLGIVPLFGLRQILQGIVIDTR